MKSETTPAPGQKGDQFVQGTVDGQRRPPEPIHLSQQQLSEFQKTLAKRIQGEVRFDTTTLGIYSTDGSNYRQVPIGAVLPKTNEDVEAAIAVCRSFEVPIVSRGCGTSLAGQTTNVAVVIDFSKYMNRMLSVDPDRKTARVQPGLILDDLRRPLSAKYHLTYGPDPSTHTHCTFGGMIGNNSCGVHSVMAGRTVDNVEELEIVTYDGLRMTVGATSDEEYAKIVAEGGRRAEIYQRVRALRDRYADAIRHRFPKTPRRSSGYSLDELLPENGFHVARSLVGAEGTLITVLEATVRLVHNPPAKTLVVLGYPDVYSAGDHIMQILSFKPIGLEALDDLLVKFMKMKGLHPEDATLLPEGRGWLLAEFGAETKDESDAQARQMMEALQKEQNPPSMKLYDNDVEEQRVWEVRESGLGATAYVPDLPIAWTGWEDAAVPPERIGDYLRDFRKLLDHYGYQASLYGHFGQGCIHCRITFNLTTAEGIRQWMEFLNNVTDLVVQYGGSYSAEHGDGQAKALFLPKMYGPELMQAFHEFKRIWDPGWKMNPGKEIDPWRPDENLRLGVDYNPWQPDTRFKFPEDKGSMGRAILRCVGVGKCRRVHGEDAFMCPSFLVTREEMHTTRGRARILFEMFANGVTKDGWRSKAVKEALELCLACKGCKSDCPVNVDMAMYKSEFNSHYYRWRLRPRPHYSMGFIGLWGNLGSQVPWLANFLSQTWGLRTITKALGGIDQRRSMPHFAAETFSHWARDRAPRNSEGPPVVIYPDVYNDCFFPQVLKAAYLILEHWGYRIIIPEGWTPAIRPFIDYGFLGLAKHDLLRTIDRLRQPIRSGVPVIFLEPSTCAVFRDELPNLLPQHVDGCRLTSLSQLIGEFAIKENLPLPKLKGKAIYHGHCHQKAVLNVGASRQVLTAMGLEYEEPQPGCCGMAGSFGFEAGHFDISNQIAEQVLLPAVRKADERTFVVAEGFSCRTQIKDGTGRDAMHLAELILTGFLNAGETAGE